MWPGFGDNMRVLNWIIDRCEDKVDAKETAIGYVPNVSDIDVTGLDMKAEEIEALLSIDKDVWMDDVNNIKEYFAQFGDKLPKEMAAQLEALEANLNK